MGIMKNEMVGEDGGSDERADLPDQKRLIREATSRMVASISAKGLRSPDKLTLDEIRMVCASNLTQREE